MRSNVCFNLHVYILETWLAVPVVAVEVVCYKINNYAYLWSYNLLRSLIGSDKQRISIEDNKMKLTN